MGYCWRFNADERPSFSDLVRAIEDFLTELMNYFDPNAGEVHLPSDPYSKWTQHQSAEAIEVEEQAETATQGLEGQLEGSEGLKPPDNVRDDNAA